MKYSINSKKFKYHEQQNLLVYTESYTGFEITKYPVFIN
jgi:hypothetical protein